jgi:hypothetical protein
VGKTLTLIETRGDFYAGYNSPKLTPLRSGVVVEAVEAVEE